MLTLKEQLPAKPVVLSPMAGFSDSPYRSLCRNLGSALSVTEFVSTEALFRSSVKSIRLFRYLESERPVIFQVFGSNPSVIINACKRILPLQPDGIDLNMGCSVRKVAHKGSGVGLMREPAKVKEIIQGMVKELKVPISVKMRLGWSHEDLNYKEIAAIVEGEGAWAITMHGRTKEMAYSGEANWQHIGELKQSLSIPVFGNGDVKSLAEAHEKMSTYGVDGVFIGRQAIGNPWLFAGKDVTDLTLAERLPVIFQHLDAMVAHCEPGRGVIRFRKHLVKYLRGFSNFKSIKNQLLAIEDKDELIALLQSQLLLAA